MTEQEQRDAAIEELKEIGTYRRALDKALILVRSIAGEEEGNIYNDLRSLDNKLSEDMEEIESDYGIYPHQLKVCPKCYSEHLEDRLVEGVADKEVAVKNEITGEMEYVEQSVDGYITTCEDCGHQEECF